MTDTALNAVKSRLRANIRYLKDELQALPDSGPERPELRRRRQALAARLRKSEHQLFELEQSSFGYKVP